MAEMTGLTARKRTSQSTTGGDGMTAHSDWGSVLARVDGLSRFRSRGHLIDCNPWQVAANHADRRLDARPAYRARDRIL